MNDIIIINYNNIYYIYYIILYIKYNTIIINNNNININKINNNKKLKILTSIRPKCGGVKMTPLAVLVLKCL